MAGIYRRSALERIASPEQMDKAITVTSPLSWLALGAVTVIVIVTLIWSVVGTLPVTVSTMGIVTAPTSTNSVYAPEAGRILEILVRENQIIRKDEPVIKYRVGSFGEPRTICAAQPGVVTRIMVTNDSDVSRGGDVLRFTPVFSTKAPQAVVCYVKQSDANKLRRKMLASVSLQSADSQTYGHMTARIVSIDEYPATESGMSDVLGTGNGLSSAFKADNPSVVAVTCELLEDSSTVSGYYWSNRRGAKKEVDTNALVNVKFIVEEVRPITKLFSKMKEIWGGTD